MTTPAPKQSTTKPRNGAKAAPKRARVDWDAIKRDYRTNKFTDIELASHHNVTREAISRKRKAEGPSEWPKDLSEAIKQATDAALVREIVTRDQQKVTDTVLAAAEVNKNVILGHRTGLKRITAIQQALLNQIEQAAQNLPDLEEVIEMVRNPDDNGMDRANDALRKALGRSALVDDLKKLTEVDERVRKGEREAFGLDDDGDEGKGDARSGRTMTDAERAVRLAAMLAKGGKA